MRSAMLAVISQDYVTVARAKGLGRRDDPVILGLTMPTGAFVMLVNLGVGVVFALVDPRAAPWA